MAKKIIRISVNDEYVLGSGVVIGAEGADESVVLRVAFNDTWAGLNIYATFRDAFGENPVAEMLMPSMLVAGELMTYDVVIPSKATATAGKIGLVFSGFDLTEGFTYNAEAKGYDRLVQRDAVMKTANAYFRVLPSDFSALDTEDKPEATLFEAVLAEINNLHGDIVEHVGLVQDEMVQHEESVAATIGELGTYEDESGAVVEHTVESRLAEQDKKVDEQNEKVAAQDEKVDKVYTAYTNGELKGEKGDQGERGIRGEKGEKGEPFTVAKTFKSFDEMNDNFKDDGVSEGSFVVIETRNVEDEDNAKLYIKGSNEYIYITDLSGAQGIKGDKGDPYKLTDQDRDDIAGVVYEKHFGDVDAALDAILAIQWQLMGAIAFTMSCYSHSANECIDTLTLYAEEGMTWGEWVNSSYNTIGAYMADGDYLAIDVNGVDYHSVLGDDGTIALNDVIIEGFDYTLYDW